jgi:hypothetical protein
VWQKAQEVPLNAGDPVSEGAYVDTGL